MPKVKDVMRDVVAFVDGNSYAGQCNQVTLPTVTVNTEEMRAGGMDAPVEMDMGMAALRATLQFMSVPAGVLKLLGKREIDITLRGYLLSSDGSKKGTVAKLSGRFIENNPGDWSIGSQANMTCVFAANRYELTIDGDQVYLIDVENYIRTINGEDVLADARQLLGLG